MNKAFLGFLFFLIVVVTAGFVASGVSAEPSGGVQANIFGDLFRRLGGGNSEPGMPEPPTKVATPPALYRPVIDYEEAVIKAIESASPAVISIIITKDLPIIENCSADPFQGLPPQFREFFGPFEFQQPCEKGTKKQEVGGGSGFIVSADGLIVTNKHVVADEKASYTVLTNDGKKYGAKILARDPVQDIAIVKIEGGGSFPAMKLGNSETVKLGQTAIAIGNALGEFRNTVSVGIISGLARAIDAEGGGTVEHLEGLIQTDAAINPGNSGGPLLNLKGEVIGMNTAIAQGAENIGFAIPINKAKRDIEAVKKTGKISVPYIGVRYVMVTEELAKRDSLPVAHGALIRGGADGPGVIKSSPADKAGIHAEDIIIELNGEEVTLERPLAQLIQKYNVGDTVRLKVARGSSTLAIQLTLEERTF